MAKKEDHDNIGFWLEYGLPVKSVYFKVDYKNDRYSQVQELFLSRNQ